VENILVGISIRSDAREATTISSDVGGGKWGARESVDASAQVISVQSLQSRLADKQPELRASIDD